MLRGTLLSMTSFLEENWHEFALFRASNASHSVVIHALRRTFSNTLEDRMLMSAFEEKKDPQRVVLWSW